MAAWAREAAISSRHSLLSKEMDALIRVINSDEPDSNRPPQVRCDGGLSDMAIAPWHAPGRRSNSPGRWLAVGRRLRKGDRPILRDRSRNAGNALHVRGASGWIG